MKLKSLLPIAFAIVALLAGPVYAGGFEISGDSFPEIKATFSSKGMDRSTPENTAKALLDSIFGIRTNHEAMFNIIKLQFKFKKNMTSSLLTKTYHNSMFDNKVIQKQMSYVNKSSYKFESFNKAEKANGVVTVTVKISTRSEQNCYFCRGAGKCPSCKKTGNNCRICRGSLQCVRCQGKGSMVNKSTATFTVDVKQDDKKNWLALGMYTECTFCNDKGQCKKCKGQQGVKCARCLGSGMCRQCKGSRRRPTDFLAGPGKFANLPDVSQTPQVDMSTPENAFNSIISQSQYMLAVEHSMSNSMFEAFTKFKKFLVHPESKLKSKSRKYTAEEYVITSQKKLGENRIRLHFAVKKDEKSVKKPKKPVLSQPLPKGRPTGKLALDLVKGKDGRWKVSQFYTKCWGCNGNGYLQQPIRTSKGLKGGKKKTCQRCQGSGLRPSQRIPQL